RLAQAGVEEAQPVVQLGDRGVEAGGRVDLGLEGGGRAAQVAVGRVAAHGLGPAEALEVLACATHVERPTCGLEVLAGACDPVALGDGVLESSGDALEARAQRA